MEEIKSKQTKIIVSVFVILSLFLNRLPWVQIDFSRSSVTKNEMDEFISELSQGWNYVMTMTTATEPEETKFLREFKTYGNTVIQAISDSALSLDEMNGAVNGINEFLGETLPILREFLLVVGNANDEEMEILSSGFRTLKTLHTVFVLVYIGTFLAAILYLYLLWKDKKHNLQWLYLIMRVSAVIIAAVVITSANGRSFQDLLHNDHLYLKISIWPLLAVLLSLPAWVHAKYLDKIPQFINSEEQPATVSKPVVKEVKAVSTKIPEIRDTAENRCPKCGYQCFETSRFCPSCGYTLIKPATIKCHNCGHENPEDSGFCEMCGSKL